MPHLPELACLAAVDSLRTILSDDISHLTMIRMYCLEF